MAHHHQPQRYWHTLLSNSRILSSSCRNHSPISQRSTIHSERFPPVTLPLRTSRQLPRAYYDTLVSLPAWNSFRKLLCSHANRCQRHGFSTAKCDELLDVRNKRTHARQHHFLTWGWTASWLDNVRPTQHHGVHASTWDDNRRPRGRYACCFGHHEFS